MVVRKRRPRLMGWMAVALLSSLLVLPAAGTSKSAFVPGSKTLAHLSQGPLLRWYASHLDQAPPEFRERFQKVEKEAAKAREKESKGGEGGEGKALGVFNADDVGLPQNEESITACRSNTNLVLGGTNDYRGLLDPEVNFTGWYYSKDGGDSLKKEGLLPSIVGGAGTTLPSGGDPVMAADAGCKFFAGSLNYDPFDPFGLPNGIGVYKTTTATLDSPSCGDAVVASDPDCWPTRRTVADSAPNHFLDKEWIDVGMSGGTEVVWIVYSDFNNAPADPSLPFTAQIKAVRCSADLVTCTSPILISGADQDIQFGDVTIGADGRTYITWSEIQGELTGDPQTFIHKLRIAPAGSTVFGPTRIIAVEDKALPFGGFLQGNDFRVATYPKNAVSMVKGKPRIFVVWDGCSVRLLDVICEEPVIKLTFSDNDGVSWSTPKVISAGGVNYFPTISDNSDGKLAAAWYTNRFDAFENAQDVELVRIDASNGKAGEQERLTKVSNETEADPLLGGFFIGDYFEVFAFKNTAWVHFNANYRRVQVLFDGVPVNQQDNFVMKGHLD